MKPLITFLMLWGIAYPTFASNPKYTPDYIRAKSPITGRGFFEYLSRLGISELDVMKSEGQRWLSVGEGNSNFTAEAAKRGVDSMALDALVVNPHSPERSRIGLAQDLPFKSDYFDRVIAVWLLDLFFSEKHFNDPATGKLAILEMIRVTKVGGDIRISPVKEPRLIATLDQLKSQGLIQYELLPYYKGGFHVVGKKRLYELTPVEKEPQGSIRVTRLR